MIGYLVAGTALLLVAIVIIVVAARRRGPKQPFAGAEEYRRLMGVQPQPTSPLNARESELRQNLRLKLLYQEDKIDDAIAFERERSPNDSLERLMEKAIARWERDNQ